MKPIDLYIKRQKLLKALDDEFKANNSAGFIRGRGVAYNYASSKARLDYESFMADNKANMQDIQDVAWYVDQMCFYNAQLLKPACRIAAVDNQARILSMHGGVEFVMQNSFTGALYISEQPPMPGDDRMVAEFVNGEEV